MKDGVAVLPECCAQEFADFFQSVYSSTAPMLSVPAAVEAAEAVSPRSSARVHVGQLTLAEVKAALKRLKPKHSCGPDGIPPFMVKDCRQVLAKPLLHIYNILLKSNAYPTDWKTTRVIPVPKGGCGTDVKSYRPVAVLSTFAKVFETVLYHSIYSQIRSQLADAQHGFRCGRSTDSNLLSFMTYAVPAVDSRTQVDAAYFDYQKAFDTVDNDVLLMKLAAIGFTPELLGFFCNYLRGRMQYVEYGGFRSQPYFTNSGVSQGSNLGPLEFVIMINDLPNVIKHSLCLLFADDLKLILKIKDQEDCELLQEDIDAVLRWSHNNKLNFNMSKCVVMTYTKRLNPVTHDYKMDDVLLTRVPVVKDLGVQMDSGLTYRNHIVNICKQAFKNLGFILRQSQDFQNITAVKALYNALVRSKLESNALIWSPYEAKYCYMLEKIQNKFLRFLYLKQYGVYPFYPLMYPTCFVLGMVGYHTLEVRRCLLLVTYIFKMLRGIISNPRILMCLGLYVPDKYLRARRHQLFVVPSARTRAVSQTPLTRALRILNCMCEGTDLDLFTCSLVKFREHAILHISKVQ